eukprot:scaffold14.g1283.t1
MRKFLATAERLLTPRGGRRTKAKHPCEAQQEQGLPANFRLPSKLALKAQGSAQEESRVVDDHLLAASTPSAGATAGLGGATGSGAAPSAPCSVAGSTGSADSSDDDSLAGFEEYLERRQAEQHHSSGDSATRSARIATPARGADPDCLPSPRRVEAPVHLCTDSPATARDGQRAEADLAVFLSSGQLPLTQARLAGLLAHTDALLAAEATPRPPATTRRALERAAGAGAAAAAYASPRFATPRSSGFHSARAAPLRQYATPSPAAQRDSGGLGSLTSRPGGCAFSTVPASARGGRGSSADCFAALVLSDLSYSRTVAMCDQLLQPLPLPARSRALAQLRSKVAGHLVGLLGGRLERVLESVPASERWAALPFAAAGAAGAGSRHTAAPSLLLSTVVLHLLEQAPCDRGETLFDLAWLWLSRQQREPRSPGAGRAARRQLADAVWRLPLAADFLACMAANIPRAAECVAPSPARPPRLPSRLSGRFSFSAEYDLHDLLELSQAAEAGKTGAAALQRQSLAVVCGGYVWYTLLAARQDRQCFELYVACKPFSLHSEPSPCTLCPPATVRLRFSAGLGLADWTQTDAERVAHCRAFWGGPVFSPAGRGEQAEGREQLGMAELLAAVRASCPYQWGGSLSMRVVVDLD